jgi:hypothetical protein
MVREGVPAEAARALAGPFIAGALPVSPLKRLKTFRAFWARRLYFCSKGAPRSKYLCHAIAACSGVCAA